MSIMNKTNFHSTLSLILLCNLVFTQISAGQWWSATTTSRPSEDLSKFNNGRCKSEEFECADGGCIDLAYKCDGENDCSDFSDEAACKIGVKLCGVGEIPCRTGNKCIPEHKVCDSVHDCTDGSDEKLHECAPFTDQISTTPHSTIPPNTYPRENANTNTHRNEVDNYPSSANYYAHHHTGATRSHQPSPSTYHHPSGSIDTSNRQLESSSSSSCTQFQYKCKNGQCIDIMFFCNGNTECTDGSDEVACSDSINNQHTSASYDSRYPQSQYTDPRYNARKEWPAVKNVPPSIKVATYDTPQTVVLGNDVVFRCRDESSLRTEVYWTRPNGEALPSNANDVNGRLTIVNLQDKDSGVYVCHAKGAPSEQATVYLNVVQGAKSSSSSLGSSSGSIHSVPMWSSPPQPEQRIPERPYYPESPYQWKNPNADVTENSPRILPFPNSVSPVNLTSDHRPPCPSRQLSCRTGIQCVPTSQVCDGRKDCLDGSDETSCPPKCTSSQFKCDNGFQCVEKNRRCNNYVDCSDGSDEISCDNRKRSLLLGSTAKCSITDFKCSSGTECTTWSYVCDGFYDCKDGSDERKCVSPKLTQVPAKEIKAMKGESVTLSCRAEGYPKPSMNWRYNMDRVSGNWPRINICTTCESCTESEAFSSIQLVNFDESFQGKWTCEAVNAVGSSISEHETDVILIPSKFVSGVY